MFNGQTHVSAHCPAKQGFAINVKRKMKLGRWDALRKMRPKRRERIDRKDIFKFSFNLCAARRSLGSPR